ncbi:MAG TPA: heavy metal-binding domain-containing protein [Synergistaceae bacterium]|nr:heavy metal-binding domain-containing protein [Synergistaceae bacterium]
MKSPVPVFTVDTLPERSLEYLGTVYATCCLSKSLVADLGANVRNWTVGGELPAYSSLMSEGVSVVLDRLQRQGEQAGADAIVGFRLSTTSIAQGAAEIIGYGTAVRYREPS